MASRFTPEQSDAAARVRSALVPGAVAMPSHPDRLFLRFAAAVVNQVLVYADDALRCCGDGLGPALPPPALVHVGAPDDQADSEAAVAFASQWIGNSGAGTTGPERAEAAQWFRTRIQVLPAVAALAEQLGWDPQCWQLAARCHEALVAELALADAAASGAAGLAAAECSGDVQGVAVMHLACGTVATMTGRLQEAMVHFDQAEPLFDQLGDVRGQAKAMLCRGAVHIARRELQAARDCQLAVLNTAGIAPVFTALATGNLGRIAFCDGEFAEAIRCGTAALRIIDGAGIPNIGQVMEVHRDLAKTHLLLGELPAARRHMATARSAADATAKDMTLASVRVAVYLTAGQLALAEGEPETALKEFIRALAVRSGSTLQPADLLEGIGLAIGACGDSIGAVAELRATLAQRRVDRVDLQTARILAHLAAAYESHDPQHAAELHAEAVARLQPFSDSPAIRLREELTAA